MSARAASARLVFSRRGELPLPDLPFIDEHRVRIAAPTPTVWRSLLAHVPKFADAEAFAHILGTEPRRASGGPLREGATLSGFLVDEFVDGKRLRLTGHHRFSRYALTLKLATESGGTTLSAQTHAEFPGLPGWLYRQFVITSGGHGLIVARMLRTVRRQAEAAYAARPDHPAPER